MKKRNRYKYKPNSVSARRVLSFIYATYPPTRTSNPQTPVYMVLQLERCTIYTVTSNIREFLPHIFTLTQPKSGGYFLLHRSNFTAYFFAKVRCSTLSGLSSVFLYSDRILYRFPPQR